MNRYSLWIAIIVLGSAVLPQPISGKAKPRVEEYIRIPDSSQVQLLVMGGGRTYAGRITRIVADEIYFATGSDTLKIFIPDIEEIKEVPASWFRNGKYWYPNRNASRLFVAPTGRPLDRGRGYATGYYVILPVVSYALTNNISITGTGYFLPSANLGAGFIMPKLGFRLGESVSLALGAGAGKSFGAIRYSVVFPYMVGTLGKPDLSASVGAGYVFYSEDTLYHHETLAFTAGGEARVTRWLSLVTESYMVEDWGFIPIASLGVRFFSERFSLDAAFINTLGHPSFKDQWPGFPFVAVTYNF